MGQFVYHSSPAQGLDVIKPHKGTHGNVWVYAAEDLYMSSVFLHRTGGGMTCNYLRVNGVPMIYERFPGAFEYRYTEEPGSTYTLLSNDFDKGMTDWEDLVSTVAQTPIEELRIQNVREYLLDLERQGKLIIQRSNSLSDQSIISHFLDWSQGDLQGAHDALRNVFPQLLDVFWEKYHLKS